MWEVLGSIASGVKAEICRIAALPLERAMIDFCSIVKTGPKTQLEDIWMRYEAKNQSLLQETLFYTLRVINDPIVVLWTIMLSVANKLLDLIM